jgi:GntR family transcriptional regulator
MARRSTAAPAPGELPLYEEIRARVTESIASGEWGPGEAIPTERELAAAFRVAIGTIRKAVDSLVAERALVRRQGKGTFVTEHDDSRQLSHFFHIVARDGHKIQPEVAMASFRRGRANGDEADALGIAPAEKVIRIRNVLSLDGSPVMVDDITLAAALFPGLSEKTFVARSNTIYQLYQSRFGINVLRTDERLRAILVPRDVASHLGVPSGTPLLEIRRVALTFRDRPVELRLSRVDTARHDYHNTLGKTLA